MILLTVAEVVELHEKIIAATGGLRGVRDAGLLESAVLGCYQTFDRVDLYPTISEKAARLLFTLCKNHPFFDGNKRVSVAAMLVTLRLNHISLLYTQQELVELGLNVAKSAVVYIGIVSWINTHLKAPPSLQSHTSRQ